MTLREGHQRPERKLSPVELKVQLHGLNLSVELFTYNPPYSLSHKTLNVRENLCLWKSDVEWSRQDQTQLDSTSASSPSIFFGAFGVVDYMGNYFWDLALFLFEKKAKKKSFT